MFDNVKRCRQKQKSSPYPPLRKNYRESLSYKIWKSIVFYIVWKQDHPPKATKVGAKTSKGASNQISCGQSFDKYVFYAFAYFPCFSTFLDVFAFPRFFWVSLFTCFYINANGKSARRFSMYLRSPL